MNYAAITIVPPSHLPADVYPDQRPYVYVVNVEDRAAVARLRQMVADVVTGKLNPTPGRGGWTARELGEIEVRILVNLGSALSSVYRAVAMPAEGDGVDLAQLA